MKIITMTRFAPERPNAPTSLNVQECDIDELKKRGWIIPEQKQDTEPVVNKIAEPVGTPDIQEEPEKEVVDEPSDNESSADKISGNKRGRKPKTETKQE